MSRYRQQSSRWAVGLFGVGLERFLGYNRPGVFHPPQEHCYGGRTGGGR
jgi:hypothetical protein